MTPDNKPALDLAGAMNRLFVSATHRQRKAKAGTPEWQRETDILALVSALEAGRGAGDLDALRAVGRRLQTEYEAMAPGPAREYRFREYQALLAALSNSPAREAGEAVRWTAVGAAREAADQSLATLKTVLAHPPAQQDREGAGDITTDGPHEINDHRRWLARQLLDSKLSEDEAYGIVAYSPAITDALQQPEPAPVGEVVTEVLVTPETLQDLIGAAYEQGAHDTHEHYQPDPDPSFKEAAWDYVASLDFTTTTRPYRARPPSGGGS